MKLGSIIKDFREQNNLTMQEFANISGLSKGYISMLEKGKHPQNNREIIPSIETVSKIATAMNLSLNELLESIDSSQQIRLATPLVVREDAPPYNVDTIAAHHDDEDWTEEELAEIEEFKRYVKSKRNK